MILLNTPKLSKLFNIQNHNVIKSQEFPKLTYTLQSFVEKMKLKFSLIGYSFKTNSALLHTHLQSRCMSRIFNNEKLLYLKNLPCSTLP